MIYWLYHSRRPIFATVAPAGASDAEVRECALAQYERVPLCHPDYDPGHFVATLRTASVHQD